tara:strand:- start:200 stop:463 length:264 start_codon:yes stop_codon:yes gene_type:complete
LILDTQPLIPYNNRVNENQMEFKEGIYVEQVFIDFSRRSVKILDSDGYDDTIEWEWTKKGADGFLETVTNIQNDVPSEIVTYCFSEQ